MVGGANEPSEESLKLKELGINVHHYLDDRKNKIYIPSLRPLALSRWLKEYPELGKLYFYHDSDIIFRELPNFNKLLQDNIIYLSDTLNYISYDYIMGLCERYEEMYPNLPKGILLEIMIRTIGISIDVVKENNKNSGGAQYLIKNTYYHFWEKVYEDCTNLYENIFEFDNRNRIYGGGIQIWTADMWALLWNLWFFGYETKISDELSFSWGVDNIQEYEQHNILHMAGLTENEKGTKFFKGEFINVSPLEKLKQNKNFFNYVDKKSASFKYVELMKSVIEKSS
jgi:hypothetical protein